MNTFLLLISNITCQSITPFWINIFYFKVHLCCLERWSIILGGVYHPTYIITTCWVHIMLHDSTWCHGSLIVIGQSVGFSIEKTISAHLTIPQVFIVPCLVLRPCKLSPFCVRMLLTVVIIQLLLRHSWWWDFKVVECLTFLGEAIS